MAVMSAATFRSRQAGLQPTWNVHHKAKRSRESGRDRAGEARAALELAEELILTQTLLLRVDEALGRGTGTTRAERTLLFALFSLGPSSARARARSITRQSAPHTANSLLRRRWVERSANPEHRGSPLMLLTAGGQTLVRGLLRKESRLYRGAVGGIGARKLRAARSVLAEFRAYVEVSLGRKL